MSGDVHVQFCERPGVRFPRATHRNLYVRSGRAGERVMASVTDFLARRLKLTVNAAKSAVDRPSARAFLGFSFTAGPTPQRNAECRIEKQTPRGKGDRREAPDGRCCRAGESPPSSERH